MVKTAEFGQPIPRVPQPGRCRVCGSTDWADGGVVGSSCFDEERGDYEIKWADDTRTLCSESDCIAEAKREIGR